MILVIGGTGTTGSAVLQRLSELGLEARALVRPRSEVVGRLPGVQVVTGQITERRSLQAALQDVDQIFLAMGNGPKQYDLELTVAREAGWAGVEHLVKVSGPADGPRARVAISQMHHRLEVAIRACVPAVTFLRPYAFFQNLLNSAPMIAQTGCFAGTTGSTPMNMVDVRDVADVAVVALTTGRTRNQTLDLTGPRTLSYPDVADHLTALGRPTRYLDQHPQEFRGALHRAGLPPWLVDHLLEIQALAVAYPQSATDAVARLTGHAPRTIEDFLADHLHIFRSAAGPNRAAGLQAGRQEAQHRLVPRLPL